MQHWKEYRKRNEKEKKEGKSNSELRKFSL